MVSYYYHFTLLFCIIHNHVYQLYSLYLPGVFMQLEKKKKGHFWLWAFFWFLFIAINSLGLYIGNLIYEEASVMPTLERKISSPYLQGEYQKGLNQKSWEEVAIQTTDGLTLKGTFIPHPSGAKRTIIYIHGFKDSRLSGINYLPVFQQSGYNVLLIDARGHGGSQGSSITWGVKEKEDIELWVAYLAKRIPRGIVGIFGASLGGATALLHSEVNETIGKHVDFYIVDSPFSDLKTLLKAQVVARLPEYGEIISTLVLPYADIIAFVRSGFTYHESSPIKAVPHSTKPILYLHGAADTLIPHTMSKELYEATRSPKDIVLFQNSAHITGYFDDPQRFTEAVRGFIKEVEKTI